MPEHLTGRDVRDVAFRKPPIGSRGYDEDAVDALLDQISDALDAWAAGRAVRLTAAEVREASLPTAAIGRRGYRATEVDAFLDRVVATLAGWEGVDPASVGRDTPREPAGTPGAEATPGLVGERRGFWGRLLGR